jgi:hypothetical protein
MSVRIAATKQPVIIDTNRRASEARPRTAESENSTPQPTFANSQRDKFFVGNLIQSRLNYQLDAQQINGNSKSSQRVAANSPAIDNRRVNDAVNTIRGRLGESITDWDVSHGDLREIQRTFRALPNRAEANTVFNRLTNSDLRNWAGELNGTVGGYSREERRSLFNDLASRLNPANLARMNNALSEGGDRVGLAQSVAQNASDAVKLGYATQLRTGVERNQDNALALATLLGGMRGRNLETAIGRLSSPQLNAVARAAIQEQTDVVSTGVGFSVTTINRDPRPLARLIDAATSISINSRDSARSRARVFEAGTNELRRIEESHAPMRREDGATVRNALTRLMNSDTTGIVNHLEQQNRGRFLSDYVQSMLRTRNRNDQVTIGNQIRRLLRGNSQRENPLDRFATQIEGTPIPGADTRYYQNARSLGFYSGAVSAAVERITDNRAEQANTIRNVFGTVAGMLGSAGSVANGVGNEIIEGIVRDLDTDDHAIRDGLRELTFPREANGNPYRGPAKDPYESAFSAGYIINN